MLRFKLACFKRYFFQNEKITPCMYISHTVRVNLTQKSNWVQFWIHIQWNSTKGATKHIRYKTVCMGVQPKLHSVRQTFTKWAAEAKGHKVIICHKIERGRRVWRWRLQLYFDFNNSDCEPHDEGIGIPVPLSKILSRNQDRKSSRKWSRREACFWEEVERAGQNTLDVWGRRVRHLTFNGGSTCQGPQLLQPWWWRSRTGLHQVHQCMR